MTTAGRKTACWTRRPTWRSLPSGVKTVMGTVDSCPTGGDAFSVVDLDLEMKTRTTMKSLVLACALAATVPLAVGTAEAPAYAFDCSTLDEQVSVLSTDLSIFKEGTSDPCTAQCWVAYYGSNRWQIIVTDVDGSQYVVGGTGSWSGTYGPWTISCGDKVSVTFQERVTSGGVSYWATLGSYVAECVNP